MLTTFKHLGTVLLLCTLLLLTPLTQAQVAGPDMRVLIDVSGSMRWNDPNNLRVPALRLLTEFLPSGSTAGVWLFAEATELLKEPQEVDAEWQQGVEARLNRIHSRGLFTNIEEAILTALEDWPAPADGSPRHLVLFTDGLVDLAAGAAASAASRERLINEHIPALQNANIQLHGLGLSDEIDQELMEQLTSRTGGWLEIAQDAATLQRIFMHMLEQTATPITVPLLDNRFTIDASIREFTVLVFREPNQPIALITPAGDRMTQANITATMRWRAEMGYDLVTVDTPMPGTWQIDAPLDPDNRVVVVTDLGLEISPMPNMLRTGEALRIQAWVTEQGQLLDRLDFLRLIEATATLTALDADSDLPHWVVLNMEPQDRYFRGHFATADLPLGVYQLDVQIDGGTFQRQIRRRIQLTGTPLSVSYNPVQPTASEDHAQLIATVNLNPSLINPSSLFGYIRLTGPGEQLAAVADIRAVGSTPPRIELPITQPGHYQVTAHLSARNQYGDTVIVELAAEQFSFEFGQPAESAELLSFDWRTLNLNLDLSTDDLAEVSWSDLVVVVSAGNGLFLILLTLAWLVSLLSRTGKKAAAPAPASAQSSSKSKGVKS